MKRFKIKYKKGIIIAAIAIIVFALASFVYALLRLLEVGKLISVSPAMDVACMLVSVIVAAFIVATLCTGGYTFKEQGLCFRMFLLALTIPYDQIQMLQFDDKQRAACLFFFTNPDASGESRLLLTFDYSHFKEFADELKNRNNAIIVIPVSSEDEEKEG